MSDKEIMIVVSSEMLPQARDLAAALQTEGLRGDVVLGQEELPINTVLPAAVVIWAPAPQAFTFFKDCRSHFPKKTTPFLGVIPSDESMIHETDPAHPNEAYLRGTVRVQDIVSAIKKLMARVAAPREVNLATPPMASLIPSDSRVVTIFSAKGGVGKTAIATNLAVAINSGRDKRVLLIDGDLQFGDVTVWLGMTPKMGITDLISRAPQIDDVAIRSTVQTHDSGIDVLLPPAHPATAERVRPEAVKDLIGLLRHMYDFIVLDTHTSYGDETLAMLDVADHILLIVTPEISVVRNSQIFLEICESLGYSDRLMAVVNRANSGIHINQLPHELRQLVQAEIISDGRAVVWSLNTGKPFVHADRSQTVSRQVLELAELIAGPSQDEHRGGLPRMIWPFNGKNGKKSSASQPVGTK